MPARYAIYYTPRPDTLLYSRVCRLFGRTLKKGQHFQPETPQGIEPERWARLVEEPAHYGLHATLKAPFVCQLPREAACDVLRRTLARVASRHFAFVTAPLVLRRLFHRNGDGVFLALVPDDRQKDGGHAFLRALEKDCVLSFEPHRAPVTEEDMTRRGPLSSKEEVYLRAYGYHRVFDLFTFHLTLTGCLSMDEAFRVEAALEPLLEPVLGRPLLVDGLSLCVQEDRSSPFHEVCRMPLRQSAVTGVRFAKTGS